MPARGYATVELPSSMIGKNHPVRTISRATDRIVGMKNAFYKQPAEPQLAQPCQTAPIKAGIHAAAEQGSPQLGVRGLEIGEIGQ